MQEVYKFYQEIRYEEWMKRIQELDACAKSMENAKNETAKEIQKKESLLRDQRAALIISAIAPESFFEIYLSFKYPNSTKMNLEEGLKLFFGSDKIPSA